MSTPAAIISNGSMNVEQLCEHMALPKLAFPQSSLSWHGDLIKIECAGPFIALRLVASPCYQIQEFWQLFTDDAGCSNKVCTSKNGLDYFSPSTHLSK